VLTLFLIAGLAMADGIDCVECCKEAGLVSCPTRIRAHGPGSHISRDSGAWRVSGIWWLDCDSGATYDDGATVALAQRPMAGQVLRMASPPSTVSCFAEHCALPQGACLRPAGETGEFALSTCTDNKMLTEAQMSTIGSAPQPAPEPTPPPPTPVQAQATGALDLTLPPPATRCAQDDGLMGAANAQVAVGDAKINAGDLPGAANTFRAALTIDPCSAGGWAGLGKVALLSDAHEIATTALKAAGGLDSKNAETWTMLGKAHAALTNNAEAIEAFDKALEIDPGNPDAQTGRAAIAPNP